MQKVLKIFNRNVKKILTLFLKKIFSEMTKIPVGKQKKLEPVP